MALPLIALFLLILWPLRMRARKRALEKAGWAELRLTGEIVEFSPERDVAQAFARRLLKRKDPPRVVLARLRKFVDEIVSDPCAKGVLVRIGTLGGGWAAAAAVRDELNRIREAGRHLVIHMEGAVDNRQAMIAATGTKVLMTPSASMSAAGVSAPGLFLKNTLNHFGVLVEAISHGRYKSAPDQFTRTDRSEADAEQTRALVDQFDDALLSGLMSGRVLNRADAEALVDAAPMTGHQAHIAGFCDGVARDEDLAEVIRAVDERDEAPRPVGAARYLRARKRPVVWPARRRHVGVVRVHGPIVDQAGPLPLPDQQMAVADSVVNDLRAALTDSNIAAVVMHVNSRGGSVTASDAIYSAAARLDREKPVIACFGDVAASGGYYVGCGARAIFASPLTVTGSIGVFGLLPTWAKLAERYSVGHDVLKNRKHAAIYNPWAGLDEEARTHTQREVSAMYDMFIELVAHSRDLSKEEVDAVAQGRVWTGRDARQHRLLDDLGGFSGAIEQAKVEAGGSFSEDIVLVTAKGPQARPAPFDPEGSNKSAQWTGEPALDGDSGGQGSPWASALVASGLAKSGLFAHADEVTLELAAIALGSPQKRTAVAYAPVILPV